MLDENKNKKEVETEMENMDFVTDVSNEISGNLLGESTEDISDDAEVSKEGELERLRREVSELRCELERREQESSAILNELSEFSKVFPDTNPEKIPDEVWDRVKGGVPLAAAYALYEKKTEAHARRLRELNEKNAEKSSGSLRDGGNEMYYSPSEVKKMSAAEVRQKYNIIIESMKKWN